LTYSFVTKTGSFFPGPGFEWMLSATLRMYANRWGGGSSGMYRNVIAPGSVRSRNVIQASDRFQALSRSSNALPGP
jgi:hypothetical protein